MAHFMERTSALSSASNYTKRLMKPFTCQRNKTSAFQYISPSSPCSEKAWQTHCNVICMSIAFFDIHETVHHKLIPDTNICVDFYNMMCGKNNLRNGTRETGSAITTLFQHILCLCRNFWTIMARLLTCTLWTLWIWHPQTASFPKIKMVLGDRDFIIPAWFKKCKLQFQSSEHRMF